MHEQLHVANASGLPAERFERVAASLRHHTSLQSVLEWCRAQSPPKDLSAVVVQDEYTHDIVLELEGELFAVYDAT